MRGRGEHLLHRRKNFSHLCNLSLVTRVGLRHVKKLTKSGIKVLVQPSNRRAFPVQDYVEAGAQVGMSNIELLL